MVEAALGLEERSVRARSSERSSTGAKNDGALQSHRPWPSVTRGRMAASGSASCATACNADPAASQPVKRPPSRWQVVARAPMLRRPRVLGPTRFPDENGSWGGVWFIPGCARPSLRLHISSNRLLAPALSPRGRGCATVVGTQSRNSFFAMKRGRDQRWLSSCSLGTGLSGPDCWSSAVLGCGSFGVSRCQMGK